MTTVVKGLYAGTFDPPTNGHLDLIRRSLKFCNTLVVAIGVNPAKKTLFSEIERIRLLNEMLDSPEFDKVSVTSFNGLLVDYAKDLGANLLIRGIRSVSDFEYEINLAGVNKTLFPQLETAFLPTDPTLSVVSSSMVKEIAKHGGNISQFVSAGVAFDLFKKLKNTPK